MSNNPSFPGGDKPQRLKANPGVGTSGNIAFTGPKPWFGKPKHWEEKFDLLEILADVMKAHSSPVAHHDGWISHDESSMAILPNIVSFEPLDKGRVKTLTTIQIHHPTLFPHGVFEYQHSIGDSTVDSIRTGFDQWVQSDWVALFSSVQTKPKCMTIVMEFPEKDGVPARKRRAVLGPVAHFMVNPPKSEPKPQGAEDHDFCPCCLMTRTMEAYQHLFNSDDFYALRYYAALDQNGQPAADCRINGEDWEEGKQALLKYAKTWRHHGIEFRKQYVILHTLLDDHIN